MKYYFPLHFDGDNRGCEGIAKGTAKILGCNRDKLIALSRNVTLDSFLGIDKSFTLVEHTKISMLSKIRKKIEGFINHDISQSDLYFKYLYRDFLNAISSDDVMISTGGDMLCYGNNMVNTTNDILHKRGIKTILWGCSMGPENYTLEKVNTLRNFTLIYARESLTYDYFKSLGLKNVVCLPDPAFVLDDESCELPHVFDAGNVIGINVSPYVFKNTKFRMEFVSLLKFILKDTDYKILLIPHVLWTGQDDRTISEGIVAIMEDQRISILDSNKYNYLQIRHIIGCCDLFIGGRTHAVISAYSMCVPTIALGYSIKSKGIAKDIGLDDKLVIDTASDNSSTQLMDSFSFLLENKMVIKQHLLEFMPGYKVKPFEIRNFLK